MAAELRSDCHAARQSLISNTETVCTQRIQMRSFLLIHSLLKRIFFFEIELRIASLLMIPGSGGYRRPWNVDSFYQRGECLFQKCAQMPSSGKCDGPIEMA